MKKKFPISVVCASHKGRERIPKFINSIFNNNCWPNEIIICGTSKRDFDYIPKKKYPGLFIKTFVSKIKNQNYQRQMAISHTKKNNIIMQLDDDLILKKNYINLMFSHFRNEKKKKIVSATILIKPRANITNTIVQSHRWNHNFYSNFLFRFVLLFFNLGKKIKYYSILSSGRICPLLPKNFIKKKKLLSNLEWTNSSICYQKSALKDSNKNLFFNEKKSYYEDVIFTHSLYKKGYNIIMDPKIVAYHPFLESINFIDYIKTIKKQFFIVKYFKKNYFFFICDVIVVTAYFFLKFILKK